MCVKFCAQFVQSAASLFMLCAVAGCGGNPNLGQVTGTVTLDGKPLPSATLMFTPDSGGATSYGKTDSTGQYRMQFSDTENGAWIGNNKVVIRTGDVLPDNSGSTPELVPAAYNRNSKLTAAVKSGSNTIDFQLDSKASKIDQVRPAQ